MNSKDLEKKWDIAKSLIAEVLEELIFNTYVKNLKAVVLDKKNNTLILTHTNPMAKDIIYKRYKSIIEEKVNEVFKEDSNTGNLKIIVILPDEVEKYKEELGPRDGKRIDKIVKKSLFEGEDKLLNPRYNFKTFVIGPNNEFAHAAALAVADAPGEAYNPLFIYGGSGLGKTHLMNAIGHRIVDNNPELRVLYVSSEQFTNEFIQATQTNKMNEFKIKYRNIDVLMIDDIQFIVAKDRTVEEVFYTYNTLYDMGKQIVFSSDRPPADMLGLDDRLKSRLASGLTVDIKIPDYETKVAILKNKAILEGIEITDGVNEVIDVISERLKTNIREMEGAFNSVIAFSKLRRKPINRQIAKEVLKDMLSAQDTMPTPDNIKKKTAKAYSIKISDLEGKKRNREISNPRQIAMYLCRELTDLSLPQIGEAFGKRDHTTVLHAINKIEEEKKFNDALNERITSLIDEING